MSNGQRMNNLLHLAVAHFGGSPGVWIWMSRYDHISVCVYAENNGMRNLSEESGVGYKSVCRVYERVGGVRGNGPMFVSWKSYILPGELWYSWDEHEELLPLTPILKELLA